MARELHARFGERGIAFADAPVARSRHAAVDGTLSIMFGGEAKTLARVRKYLECMGTDITHCGGPGTGQVVKILNNMLLFDTCVSIAETLVVGERAGVEPRLLLETLSKGSADSFALRSHATKSMLTDDYPTEAFSVRYVLKDLTYALELAEESGVDVRAGKLVREYFAQAIEAGLGEQYHPVIKNTNCEGRELGASVRRPDWFNWVYRVYRHQHCPLFVRSPPPVPPPIPGEEIRTAPLGYRAKR